MFPRSGFNDLLYPMTADVYYATESQNDFGEIIKDWVKDRTIQCSVSKRSPTRISNVVENGKFIEYDTDIHFRTAEDILTSTDDNIYHITDIFIKDIKDSKGLLIWKESEYEGTVFEIRAIEPMLNMFSVLDSYRINLMRSDQQDFNV